MTHILISGAGVAGTALAYWLRRYGIDVTVVERAPGLRQGGQGIDVRGAARDVIDRMGLTDQVRAAHTGVHGIRQVDAAGRVRVEMGADAFGHSGGIIADLEILRSDLVRILSEAGEGVEYVFDDTITAMEQGAGGVLVTFGRAGRRRFDAVVGADGVFSVTRRLAFPAARLVDGGYHRAVFTMDDAPALDGWELMHTMPAGNGTTGGRNAMLYPAHGGARGMVHFAGDPVPYDRRDIDQQKRIVASVFEGEGWYLPRMLDAMWRADDFYFDRHGRVETPWHDGRVGLLGDACAAGSVGMGTTIALVGAYVLAGELAEAGGDPLAAFPAYETLMRPYVAANVRPLPGGVKGFLPPTAGRIRAGQTMMRWLLRTPLGPAMMGGMDKAVSAIDLPDYAVEAAA